VGLHAWSHDGLNWTLAKPDAAYGYTVQWDDGTNTTFAERERPVLLFDDNGKPTHLINGVRAPNPPNATHSSTYTLRSFPNSPTHTIAIPLVAE
jgi:hypothetical protein